MLEAGLVCLLRRIEGSLLDTGPFILQAVVPFVSLFSDAGIFWHYFSLKRIAKATIFSAVYEEMYVPPA